MEDYIIAKSTDKECELVDRGIVKYNNTKVPFTQEPAFIPINRVIKNSNGDILAGINSILYCWNCLYIDVLWVKDEHRKKGYGSILLDEVEK